MKIKYNKSLMFLIKGFLGYVAYLVIMPSWLSPLIHRIRGVKIHDLKKTYIAPNVLIDSLFPELLTIEEEVYITRGSKILTHFNPTDPQKIIIGKESIKKSVYIKKGAFIGVGAIVMPGVTIGECAVVGSGAVVTKDVSDFAIVGGNPARLIGDIRNLES